MDATYQRWRRYCNDKIKAILNSYSTSWWNVVGILDILINWEKYYKKNYTGLIAYDNQVGSGYSDSLHGRRQYFDSIDTLSDDLSKFIKDTRSNYPGNIPILVLGESFGATVALHSILRPPSAPSPTITPTADDADDDATTLLTTDDIYLVQ